jgi:tetratricopeptide repeat protein/PEGA domain-containing protein
LISSYSSCDRGWILLPVVLNLLLLFGPGASAQRAKRPAERAEITSRTGTGVLTVITEQAGSVLFINNIRHGITNESGTLQLPRVPAGSYPVRARSTGFQDWSGSVTIVAGSARTLRIVQKPTSDQPVLHYQKAEQLRDQAKNAEAVQEYKQAIELRGVFPEARVALARSLVTLQAYDEAEKQLITAMKEHRTPFVEAQTVLANLRRYQGLVDESIGEYRKALRLARGISPEAHIGLAIALEEAGHKEESIREYRLGISQDMDTEPILYFLLGNALEKAERKKDAIEAYNGYLQLDPEGQYASAVESIIKRLKEELDDK